MRPQNSRQLRPEFRCRQSEIVSTRNTALLCVRVTVTGPANGASIPRRRKRTFHRKTDGVDGSGRKSALNCMVPAVSLHFTRPPVPLQVTKVWLWSSVPLS